MHRDDSLRVDGSAASTRWDSSRCIDWGITKGFEKLLFENGGTTLLSIGHSQALSKAAQPVFRLRPTVDLRRPEDVTKEDWMDILEKVGIDIKHYISHLTPAGLSFVTMPNAFVLLPSLGSACLERYPEIPIKVISRSCKSRLITIAQGLTALTV